MAITLRLFQPQDATAIAQLFHDTVRTINRRDYSAEQVAAWAPDDLNFRDWATVCAQRWTYVAETAGQIVGFAELEPHGHIDCFYCHKDFQGQGIGRRLYEAIEAKAQELELRQLDVEASITAKPFFQRLGFVVVTPQQVTRRGQTFTQTFTNYVMTKRI
ncbi:MAG: GNAT family N-acetyltransferase [Synechococcales cyanobacterium M58_A2018_015]|nr:GNAT family N-acetyltransferase [Synechococcales cyanobacterium M58_A2018_015]